MIYPYIYANNNEILECVWQFRMYPHPKKKKVCGENDWEIVREQVETNPDDSATGSKTGNLLQAVPTKNACRNHFP